MNIYKKIFFVCVGNTCRSPMAATIMRNELQRAAEQGLGSENIVVDSRGMVVLFPEPYNPKAVAVAAGHGMIMPSNSAAQIQNKDFGSDTLVLVMNPAMKQKLYDTFDRAINVYTLCEFAGAPEQEVPDPYGRGIEEYGKCFEELWKLVRRAAENIIKNMQEEQKETDKSENLGTEQKYDSNRL